jgi:hypothetical protein
MKSIFTLTLLFLTTVLIGQSRIFVNASALGQNDGSSWANAFKDLQPALAAAVAGDEIWVAQGTYFPTLNTNRDSSFNLPSGVRLYGGFRGTESDLSQRDWAEHPTTLSGDIGVPGDSTDNSYTVVYLDNPDSLTLVDGFLVESGTAWFVGLPATNPRNSGGGMYIMGEEGEAYPTIRNCIFKHNNARYGGAVYINGTNNGSAAPMFLNCVFERNTAAFGAGVYRNGGSWVERTPDFGGCSFLNNKVALRGGGVYFKDSEGTDTLQIWDTKFIGNANGEGAGMCMDIGRHDGSKISVKGCDFQLNFGADGSAMLISNKFSNSNTDFVLIEDTKFFENYGALDALILVDGFGASDNARTVIANCVISGNSLSPNIHTSILKIGMSGTGAVSIRNTVIQENRAGNLISVSAAGKLSINHCFVVDNETYAGRLFGAHNNNDVEVNNTIFYNNTYNAIGPAIGIRAAKVKVRNSVFQAKRMFYHEPTNPTNPLPSEAEVYNSILLVDEIISNEASQKQTYNLITHSLLNGVNFDCTNPPEGVTCGQGNLFGLDPLFRDTINGDYSLLPCSPLLNAGLNAAAAGIPTDLAGNPRILGGTVDIGAYENVGLALSAAPQVQPTCLGASNGSISIALEDGDCGPYTYQWTPNAGSGSELDGLPPGSYIFTITDGSGRQISDTVTVNALPSPALALVPTDVLCGAQAGGTLSASVQGGTAPFEYLWSPAAEDTPLLTQQQPGAYALTIVDANGCQDSATAAIALMGQITLTIGGQIIPCHGETGWLSATPSTGAAPFSWLWDGWPGTDPIAEPLGPGQYSVTVTDAYGCTAANTYPPMTEPGPLSVGTGSSDQTQNNPPNGAAVVTTISGGTGPFGYLWEPGGGTAQSIAGLVAGTYTVTVTDKNGCSISAEVVVEQMVSSTASTLEGGVIIYPNPATDWLRVLLPAAQSSSSWHLELSDASGRVLRSQGCQAGDCVLDLSGLASGAYVLMARSGERVFKGKVVRR